MTAWQSFVYYTALACFRAWGDYLDARKLAERELVTDEDLARANRFKLAVDKLLQDKQGNTGPENPSPAK